MRALIKQAASISSQDQLTPIYGISVDMDLIIYSVGISPVSSKTPDLVGNNDYTLDISWWNLKILSWFSNDIDFTDWAWSFTISLILALLSAIFGINASGINLWSVQGFETYLMLEFADITLAQYIVYRVSATPSRH